MTMINREQTLLEEAAELENTDEGAEQAVELTETEQPASMHRVIDIADDDPPEPEPDEPPARGWKHTADVEQRQRLYAARKASEILREYGGDGVFSTGGSKSVDPVHVVTLAQWIVYGAHVQ